MIKISVIISGKSGNSGKFKKEWQLSRVHNVFVFPEKKI
jgi:hypothetical protein